MIGPEIPIETQRAFGYAGAGALALKALDLLVKWRTGQRQDTLSELKEAVSESRKLRTDLRAELEMTRADLAASELHTERERARAEKAEGELLAVRHQLETTDRALGAAVDELRMLRFVHSKCPPVEEA